MPMACVLAHNNRTSFLSYWLHQCVGAHTNSVVEVKVLLLYISRVISCKAHYLTFAQPLFWMIQQVWAWGWLPRIGELTMSSLERDTWIEVFHWTTWRLIQTLKLNVIICKTSNGIGLKEKGETCSGSLCGHLFFPHFPYNIFHWLFWKWNS